MNCEDHRALMPGLLEDDLSSRDNEKLSAHLRECPACRDELRLLSDSLDLFRASALSEPELSPYLASRIAARAAGRGSPRRSFSLKLAAGLGALAAIAAVYAGVALGPRFTPDKTAGLRIDSINFQSPAMGVEIEKNRFVLHSRDTKGKAAVDLNL